ncbi:MAG: hypothetical protein KatS3mg102_0784 [Planctomycetota bacterium]|nr:MAG: hypothetical protein KatS3mg102_0784 [Planctomycetota bacterium]
MRDAPLSPEQWQELPPYSRAVVFAAWAHRAQRRKWPPVDYLRHPLEVAALLSRLGAAEPTLLAAVLHDTVEDTEASLEQIERRFGAEVAGLVGELTNPAALRRQERLAYFRRKMGELSLPALQIKLADRLHNLEDCRRAPPDFRARYCAEAQAMLQAIPAARRADRIVAALAAAIDAVVRELSGGAEPAGGGGEGPER